MATLFQLHGNADNLKKQVTELRQLWQAGDSILLLGDSITLIDELQKQLKTNDINNASNINTSNIYALANDLESLSPHSQDKLQLPTKVSQIRSDDDWVKLTQKMDKVVTLV